MKSLADFKRVLAVPGVTLTLIEFYVNGEKREHKFLNVPRTVKKLQTNSFCLVTATGATSWGYFGKAAEWVFTETRAIQSGLQVVLVYEITKGVVNLVSGSVPVSGSVLVSG